tara:strand:+ start:489 stop:1340 length:852 start_codon:yes stop_codon:yes gene_type:complete
LLGVNRQVYYRSKKRQVKRRETAQIVVNMVQELRITMPKIGGRKLYYLLQDKLNPLGVGRDRLFAILKANHLLIQPKRQYHITTNSHHHFRKHKNLVKSFDIDKPEQVWVSDITYLGNRSNPMYLALVTDAYSKQIMGYNVSNSLNAEGTCRALKMAIKNRTYKSNDLVHHSDRGLQYCCEAYQDLLRKHNIKCSMTEQYDPYENAVAERVNGILKQEFIEGIKVSDIDLMHLLIADAIDIYNTKRPHLSNYMLPPIKMHSQKIIKMKTYKTKKENEDISVLS